MFFDTHSHLNFPAFEEDLDQVVAAARENGVGHILVVGTGLESSRAAIRAAEKHSLYASVGIHPSEAGEGGLDPRPLAELMEHERVIAVGETGLDRQSRSDFKKQEAAFRLLLEMASGFNLPAIIHSRDAAGETLAVLEDFFAAGANQAGAVWHCFSGDEKLAGKALDLGLHISFTGNITYRKNTGLRETLASVPLERLMLETDCPFLPPEGRRGRRNEPAWLPLVLPMVAELKKMTKEETTEKIFQTSRDFFLSGKKKSVPPVCARGQARE